MQKPHDSAHSAFMKPTFLPHSPASAHEPHAELESLHGGSCATEREEAPKAASSAKLTRIQSFTPQWPTPVAKSTKGRRRPVPPRNQLRAGLCTELFAQRRRQAPAPAVSDA